MRMKIMSLLATLLLVAACESTPSDDGSAGGNGGASMGQVVPGSQQDLSVNVGDRVLFQLDKSDLTAEGRATLDKQAAWLAKYPNVRVSIEGHCDERGTREYNLALGERRATAVKNYLTAAGVAASRVTTVSFGKERPAVVGTGEAVWSQNRRGVTVVQ
jgi:peptidoglycan-associated lipoprotein